MSQKNMVSIQQASDMIGVSVVSLHGSKLSKYSSFRHKPKGQKIVMFDVDGYLKRDETMESLQEITKLFVEYLNKIEGVSYTDMAKLVKTHTTTLCDLSFGEKLAYKIAKAYAIHRPFHFKRFDEYYGWKHKPMKTIKVFR